MHDLDPYEFEQFIGVGLDALGVEEVEVTKRSGVKGIDVKGRLVLHGVISRRVAVSVKRYRSKVGSAEVRDLRSSLASHELGVVISTADSPPAPESRRRSLARHRCR